MTTTTDTNVHILNDAWIPVIDLATGDTTHIGAHRALTHAHQYQLLGQLSDASYPAVLKFLLGLWAATGTAPHDYATWRHQWQHGFDTDGITTYMHTWHERFYLLHDTYPFMQCPNLEAATRDPDTLRDGYYTSNSGRDFGMDGQAARDHWNLTDAIIPLIRAHGIDTAGIKTGVPGAKGGKSYGAQLGPLAAAAQLLPYGGTLAATLLLCWTPAPRLRDDAPAWERAPRRAGTTTRTVTGVCDWLTWQSRSLKLFTDTDGTITGVAWHDGDRVTKDTPSVDFDPCAVRTAHGTRPSLAEYNKAAEKPVPHISAARVLSQLLPWNAAARDLDLKLAFDDSHTTFCRTPVMTHLTTAADTIADTPIRLQIFNVKHGTQFAVINDIDILDQPYAAISLGTGHTLADPIRRAIMGVVVNAIRQGHSLPRYYLGDDEILRTLTVHAPSPDLDAHTWNQLTTALAGDDPAEWKHAATAAVTTALAPVATWLENSIASPQVLRRAQSISRTLTMLAAMRKTHLSAITDLASQHIPA